MIKHPVIAVAIAIIAIGLEGCAQTLSASAALLLPNRPSPPELQIHGGNFFCVRAPGIATMWSQQPEFFIGWEDEDFDRVEQWASECDRYQLLGSKAQAEHVQWLESMRTQENSRRAAVLAQQALAAQCFRSDAYALYQSRTAVLTALNQEQLARQQLEHEKRVADISGSVDLSSAHAWGELAVSAQDRFAQAWKAYKSHGGIGKSPDQMPMLQDPCTSDKIP